MKEETIENIIEIVENALVKYKENENLSNARKLIQKGFKDSLDSYIESEETDVNPTSDKISILTNIENK